MAEEDRYRLAPVRDARARDERVRRGDLVDAVGDARATQEQLAALHARVTAARERVEAAIAVRSVPATAAHLALADRFVVRRRRELADALAEELRVRAAHDARLGAVEAARLTLARARAEREVIERHFGRWRDARKKLADRRDD